MDFSTRPCGFPPGAGPKLCDLLADSGVAGCPDSFFRRESFLEWTEYFGLSVDEWGDAHEFDQAYLSAVLRYGTAETPVFGMRLMWESVTDLLKRLELFYPDQPSDRARLQSAFGSPLYLHLSRNDKVAQAVSRLMAEQTGLWHVSKDGAERERLWAGRKPAYDAQRLSKLVATLEAHDAAWRNWFSRQGIEPLRIPYEALSTTPQATLATVLSALGQDPAIAQTLEPQTVKLANAESREWARRFRSEENRDESP